MATFIKPMGKELVNGRECKMAAITSHFEVFQTKCFTIFINSKVAGEYKTDIKDYILFFISTI